MVDDAFLQQAKALLAIRSTRDRPEELKRALDFVAARVEKQPDVKVERFEHNGVHSFLAYYGEKRPDRFKVLLNGHVDVVAGKEEQFIPRIEGGRLYGRGALDMKVAALVMADAFCQVASHVSYPLGLQIVTDEEIGGYDGAAYQFSQGITADFFITGEQSANNVVVAAKGICWLKIRQKGIASHGAYQWRGDNAIVKLVRLVEKIHSVYPQLREEAWETTASVAQLTSTSEGFFNRVPDAAELHIDFRFIPEDKNFATRQAVQDFIASLDPAAEVEFVTFENGPHVELDHPMVKKLLEITSEVKGAPVLPIHRHAGSDARHLITDLAMRAVEYGIGGSFEHSDGEYAELGTIAVMQKALLEFLLAAQ
jgi:succinyl-diaminopimelate desuccinylase